MIQCFWLRLSDSKEFDKSDLSLYLQFESQLMTKLEIDRAAIEDDNKQIWYEFSKLEEKAAVWIHFWMIIFKNTMSFILDNFFKQLCKIFQNSAMQQKMID